MRRPIEGFERISNATAVAAGISPQKANSTRVGWVRCADCGKVIQGSGLGIGSHRRACKVSSTPSEGRIPS